MSDRVARIESVDAWEILDSRGNPTLRVAVSTPGGTGRFAVPAGASTGSHAVLDRRDGGERYRGRGVREAVRAVTDDIAPELVGRDATAQREVDAALVERDGSADLSTLGGNAVLGASGAVARAASAALDVPPFAHLSALAAGEAPTPDGDRGSTGSLPTPMVNVLSGGLHAAGGIEIQDFLAVPVGRETYEDALRTVWEVRQAARDLVLDAGARPLVADEGGFAPPLDGIDDAFALLERAVERAGHDFSRDDVAVAVDVAATHFRDGDGTYRLESVDRSLSGDEMVELVAEWTDAYPLVSVEDPLAEDDWSAWSRLTDAVGDRVQVLGDDLLVTDAARLDRAVETGAANAVLVKPNQTGTLTRVLDLLDRARALGVAPVVSARSGETADSTIADLAAGCGVGQIKIGSLARSERLAKYNRLLELSHRYDPPFPDVREAFGRSSRLSP